MYVYIYIHTYIHIHTYTHTHPPPPLRGGNDRMWYGMPHQHLRALRRRPRRYEEGNSGSARKALARYARAGAHTHMVQYAEPQHARRKSHTYTTDNPPCIGASDRLVPPHARRDAGMSSAHLYEQTNLIVAAKGVTVNVISITCCSPSGPPPQRREAVRHHTRARRHTHTLPTGRSERRPRPCCLDSGPAARRKSGHTQTHPSQSKRILAAQCGV